MIDLLIKNADILDGTGAPAYKAHVACIGNKIEVIKGEVPGATKMIDGTGLYVAPGFIDAHSHGDLALGNMTNSLSKVSQGITTQVTGHCGISIAPLNSTLYTSRKAGGDIPAGVSQDTYASYDVFMQYARSLALVENICFFTGHENLRVSVMGYDNRHPTSGEMAQMKHMLEEAMLHGAMGLSSGLIYTPSAYSDEDELVELCQVVAKYDGIYATHMRNESDHVVDAIQEAIRVARRSGCRLNISHLKVCGIQNHGVAPVMLEKIREAREEGITIYVDQYPYTASSTLLDVCIPPRYYSNGIEGMIKHLSDPSVRVAIKEEMLSSDTDFENLYLGCGGFEGIMVSSSPALPQAAGKTIAQYALETGQEEFDAFFEILLGNEGMASAIYFDIGDEDLETIIKEPHIMIATDGATSNPGELVHPRTYGTFPRAIGTYVRDKKLVSLPEMIHRMTGFTASNFCLVGKGRIANGMDADLVVFNYAEINDRADYIMPTQLADGIKYVIVSGKVVYEEKKLTGQTPGNVLVPGKQV